MPGKGVRGGGLNIPYDLPTELNNFCSCVVSPQLQILPLPNLPEFAAVHESLHGPSRLVALGSLTVAFGAKRTLLGRPPRRIYEFSPQRGCLSQRVARAGCTHLEQLAIKTFTGPVGRDVAKAIAAAFAKPIGLALRGGSAIAANLSPPADLPTFSMEAPNCADVSRCSRRQDSR